MNNNRNNRRRGRGNRKQGSGGQGNRIDSRARGNAPQLLDKYKKLAQDAQHNGDRVQAEYYLQFADHYFRVIADNKARQDEQRGPRRHDEEDEDDDGLDERDEQPQRTEPRRARRDRDERREYASDDSDDSDGDSDGDDSFEAAENPFVRRDRDREEGGRTRKPRARKSADKAGERSGERASERKAAAEIDQSVLPPAIGRRAENDSAEETESEAKPAPRRRRRKSEEDSAVAAE